MSSVSLRSDGSGSGSGSGSSGPAKLFRCRLCPGQEFTAAERDAHRITHRNRNESARSGRDTRKSGPRSRKREASPARSTVTLFEPIASSPDDPPQEKSRSKRPKRKPEPRKSKKTYNSPAAVMNRKFSSG